MDIVVDKSNNEKIKFNCTPKEASPEFFLSTKNKAVAKDLEINYEIPSFSSSYITSYTINPSVYVGSKQTNNNYSFGYYQFSLSCYPSSVTFNASNLPKYSWYSENYKLSYTVNSFSESHRFEQYSSKAWYSSSIGATQYISSGSTRTESVDYDYRGLEVWVSEGSNFYKYTTVPNKSGTFYVDDNDVTPGGSPQHIYDTYLCVGGRAASNRIGAAVRTYKYQGNPEIPSFYIRLDWNVVQSSDSGVSDYAYFMPQLPTDVPVGQTYFKTYGSNPTWWDEGRALTVQNTCFILYTKDGSWHYYQPNTQASGTMTGWELRWSKELGSNYCPFLFRMTMNLI